MSTEDAESGRTWFTGTQSAITGVTSVTGVTGLTGVMGTQITSTSAIREKYTTILSKTQHKGDSHKPNRFKRFWRKAITRRSEREGEEDERQRKQTINSHYSRSSSVYSPKTINHSHTSGTDSCSRSDTDRSFSHYLAGVVGILGLRKYLRKSHHHHANDNSRPGYVKRASVCSWTEAPFQRQCDRGRVRRPRSPECIPRGDSKIQFFRNAQQSGSIGQVSLSHGSGVNKTSKLSYLTLEMEPTTCDLSSSVGNKTCTIASSVLSPSLSQNEEQKDTDEQCAVPAPENQKGRRWWDFTWFGGGRNTVTETNLVGSDTEKKENSCKSKNPDLHSDADTKKNRRDCSATSMERGKGAVRQEMQNTSNSILAAGGTVSETESSISFNSSSVPPLPPPPKRNQRRAAQVAVRRIDTISGPQRHSMDMPNTKNLAQEGGDIKSRRSVELPWSNHYQTKRELRRAVHAKNPPSSAFLSMGKSVRWGELTATQDPQPNGLSSSSSGVREEEMSIPSRTDFSKIVDSQNRATNTKRRERSIDYEMETVGTKSRVTSATEYETGTYFSSDYYYLSGNGSGTESRMLSGSDLSATQDTNSRMAEREEFSGASNRATRAERRRKERRSFRGGGGKWEKESENEEETSYSGSSR